MFQLNYFTGYRSMAFRCTDAKQRRILVAAARVPVFPIELFVLPEIAPCSGRALRYHAIFCSVMEAAYCLSVTKQLQQMSACNDDGDDEPAVIMGNIYLTIYSDERTRKNTVFCYL